MGGSAVVRAAAGPVVGGLADHGRASRRGLRAVRLSTARCPITGGRLSGHATVATGLACARSQSATRLSDGQRAEVAWPKGQRRATATTPALYVRSRRPTRYPSSRAVMDRAREARVRPPSNGRGQLGRATNPTRSRSPVYPGCSQPPVETAHQTGGVPADLMVTLSDQSCEDRGPCIVARVYPSLVATTLRDVPRLSRLYDPGTGASDTASRHGVHLDPCPSCDGWL